MNDFVYRTGFVYSRFWVWGNRFGVLGLNEGFGLGVLGFGE